mmetsp:Transcript_11353/g.26582  ORF Transcript_11353/g.26582 Transcript_11353/m.26582 type:complete len:421 (+) Transcript_11353:172-1434(+)
MIFDIRLLTVALTVQGVGARLSPDRNTSVDEDGVNDVDESNIQQSLSEKVERVLASDDPCAGNPRCIGRNACPSDKDFIGCGSCIADHNACRDYSGIIGTNSCVALDGPDKDSSPCLGNGWLGGTPLDGRIDNQSCIGWRACYLNSGQIDKNSCTDGVGYGLYSSRFCHAVGLDYDDCGSDEVCAYVRPTSDIGTHSCMGDRACYKAGATIGDYSCLGNYACEDMGPGGKTDRDSCWGVEACAGFKYAKSISIGKGSCIDTRNTQVCYRNSGGIGTSSCIGKKACLNNEGKIGSISCHSELTRYNRGDFVAHDGAKACADNTGSVGNQACQGDMSCHKNEGAISNESCLGNHACFENKGSVGTRSCIAKDSCNGNTGKIGKNACTLVGSCANNDKDIPDDCPSRDQLTKCENRGATCPCV